MFNYHEPFKKVAWSTPGKKCFCGRDMKYYLYKWDQKEYRYIFLVNICYEEDCFEYAKLKYC